MSFDEIFKSGADKNASDIHLKVGYAPSFRIDGDMVETDMAILNEDSFIAELSKLTSKNNLQNLKDNGGLDFGYSIKGLCRFRINAHKTKGTYGLVARRIPDEIINFDSIGLPKSVRDLLRAPRGLVLVTGPTGSGKSTTLASMIDIINQERKSHIVTIEDPIEYNHNNKCSVVTQREIGDDVKSFAFGLREVLRQDPDVILVGEMRDLETMEAAVTAAETGHLVFATLHTTGAARTVDRIIDAFPSHMKDQIRTQLASSVLAVISQVLCKKEGGGRIAAFEYMVNTPAISQLIREDKTYRIASEIQTGADKGMVGLDKHLSVLAKDGKISKIEGEDKAQDKEQFLRNLNN